MQQHTRFIQSIHHPCNMVLIKPQIKSEIRQLRTKLSKPDKYGTVAKEIQAMKLKVIFRISRSPCIEYAYCLSRLPRQVDRQERQPILCVFM